MQPRFANKHSIAKIASSIIEVFISTKLKYVNLRGQKLFGKEIQSAMRKMKYIWLFFMILLISVSGCTSLVYASKSVKLPVNKTIKNLDFNGDGKKDTFKAYNYNSSEGKITLSLNGKKNRLFVARGTNITYCKFSKKQIYLFVYMHQFGGGTIMVYRYKGNHLKQVNSSLGVFDSKGFDHVKGDYVYFCEGPYHQFNISGLSEESGSYGITSFIFRYKLDRKKRKFKLASRYGTPKKDYHFWYTGSSFTTSNNPEKQNKKGLTVHKYDWVKLCGIYKKPYRKNGYTLLMIS